MSSDVEHWLEQLTPCGAPASLREQVLEAAAQELAARSTQRRQRRWGLTIAAAVLLGLALNLGIQHSQESRLAQLYGPEPVPQQVIELARAVESVADAQTAAWLQGELLKAVRQRAVSSRSLEKSWFQHYQEILKKDGPYEEAPQVPQGRRDDRRGAAGDWSAQQCCLDLDDRIAA